MLPALGLQVSLGLNTVGNIYKKTEVHNKMSDFQNCGDPLTVTSVAVTGYYET